jgi:hypothetical protein
LRHAFSAPTTFFAGAWSARYDFAHEILLALQVSQCCQLIIAYKYITVNEGGFKNRLLNIWLPYGKC